MFEIRTAHEANIVLGATRGRSVSSEVRGALEAKGFLPIKHRTKMPSGEVRKESAFGTSSNEETTAFAQALVWSGKKYRRVLGLKEPPDVNEMRALIYLLAPEQRVEFRRWLESSLDTEGGLTISTSEVS